MDAVTITVGIKIKQKEKSLSFNSLPTLHFHAEEITSYQRPVRSLNSFISSIFIPPSRGPTFSQWSLNSNRVPLNSSGWKQEHIFVVGYFCLCWLHCVLSRVFNCRGTLLVLKTRSTSWVNKSKMDIYEKGRPLLSSVIVTFTTEPSLFVFQNKVMNIDAVKVKLQVRTSSFVGVRCCFSAIKKQNKTKKRSSTVSRGVSASHTSSFPAAGGWESPSDDLMRP